MQKPSMDNGYLFQFEDSIIRPSARKISTKFVTLIMLYIDSRFFSLTNWITASF